MRYDYNIGQEVTINYPSGNRRDGEIVERRQLRNIAGRDAKRYTVYFPDEDAADPLVAESWLEARGQERMIA